MEVIIKVISAERDRAREICEALIDAEQNYLFTNDSDYMSSRSETISNDTGGGGPHHGQGGPEGGRDGGPGGAGHGQGPRQGGNHFVNELR